MPLDLSASTPDRLAYLLREAIPSLPLDFSVDGLAISDPYLTGSVTKNTAIDVLNFLNFRGLKSLRYQRVLLSVALAGVSTLPPNPPTDLYGLLPYLLSAYGINISQDDIYNEPIGNGTVRVMAKSGSFIFIGATTLPFDQPLVDGAVIGLDDGSLYALDDGSILADN